MATKKKGNKNNKKSKKSKHGRGLLKLLFAIIALVLISLLIAYVIVSSKGDLPKTECTTASDKVEKQQSVQAKHVVKEETIVVANEPSAQKKSDIEGTWLSNINGTMLTLTNDNYTIDFMSVDAQEPMEGKFTIEGEGILFFNEKSRCQDIRGEYRFSLFDDSTLIIETIHDDCPKREASLDSDWKRI